MTEHTAELDRTSELSRTDVSREELARRMAGDLVWDQPVFAYGCAGSPTMVVPNIPGKLGIWQQTELGCKHLHTATGISCVSTRKCPASATHRAAH